MLVYKYSNMMTARLHLAPVEEKISPTVVEANATHGTT